MGFNKTTRCYIPESYHLRYMELLSFTFRQLLLLKKEPSYLLAEPCFGPMLVLSLAVLREKLCPCRGQIVVVQPVTSTFTGFS
jgi:hypothetical protein